MSNRQLLDLAATEAEFQSTVIELAHVRGWLVYHTHRSDHSPKGFPDLCLARADPRFCRPDGRYDLRIVFAELKREKRSEPTPAQRQWLDVLGSIALVSDNIECHLWRPSDWERIEEVLR